MTALRILPSQLAEIDRRARAVRLTRTDYMIRCALGEPLDPPTTNARLAVLEERVQRLEGISKNDGNH